MENKWTSAEHARRYLDRADSIPHRGEGETALLEHLPESLGRVLDIGTGDGRLLALVLSAHAEAGGVGVDFSPTMLAAAGRRFARSPRVELIEHDIREPLPDMGTFDAVVSSFAIHHCAHRRKRGLYEEIRRILEPGGIFLNLDHVASPSERLHREFLEAIGRDPDSDDHSNLLLAVETQLKWLRELRLEDVDCHWKWREMALFGGRKPVRRR